MNQQLWQQHLQARVDELERDVSKLRRLVGYQRGRAEHWKHRALRKRTKRDA